MKKSITGLITFILIFFSDIFSQNLTNTPVEQEQKLIYQSISNNLVLILGFKFRAVSFGDSIFTPSNEKWVEYGNGELSAIDRKSLNELFTPNQSKGLFLFKDSIEWLNCEPQFKLKNYGTPNEKMSKIIVSFSGINFSKNGDCALVFIKVDLVNEGYVKLKAILRKLNENWFIVYFKTYEMT